MSPLLTAYPVVRLRYCINVKNLFVGLNVKATVIELDKMGGKQCIF